MVSLILQSASRVLLPTMLLFSFFILLRGHNEPGGGFIGGLIASAAYALYALAFDVQTARHALRVKPFTLIAIGLAMGLISATVPLFNGQEFFTILWYADPLPILGKVGTAFTFDTGVFFVVLGVTLTIIFAMAEDDEQGEGA